MAEKWEWVNPSKEKGRLSSPITMKATVQINIFTKCLKLAMLQGTRLGNFFPLFCQDNLHRQTCSRAARKVPCNTFCCSTGKVMWYMNNWVQDKNTFGQHPASNGFVVLGINKFRGMDPGQQKTLNETMVWGKLSIWVDCSFCDCQQEERAAGH